MIRYRLQCSAEHQFEAWFASSAAYDRQEEAGLLECPHCGTHDVRKALMAPNVATRKVAGGELRDMPALPVETGKGADPPSAACDVPARSDQSPQAVAMRHVHDVLKAVRDKVRAEAEYVGPRFAEEARRIHHEEAPDRGIYGEATSEEVKSLAEDGIDVLPMPRLPEDLS